eukprot:TRINITY_DN5006_c0_g2_i1.p1 TRINITY_DN5006_c0_g2~~TRINITY_DN5006_c0_g2_i1.p1  ORF type:complete len:138 (-),score=21.03 TRINITY_DN5006_c0_g2_i1:41-454(-)
MSTAKNKEKSLTSTICHEPVQTLTLTGTHPNCDHPSSRYVRTRRVPKRRVSEGVATNGPVALRRSVSQDGKSYYERKQSRLQQRELKKKKTELDVEMAYRNRRKSRKSAELRKQARRLEMEQLIQRSSTKASQNIDI